jgi:hypothetical protein
MVAMTQVLWIIYEKPPVENPSIGVVEIKVDYQQKQKNC